MITYLRATNSLAIGSRTYPRGQLAPNIAPERGLFVVKRLVELSSLRVTAEMAAARDGS